MGGLAFPSKLLFCSAADHLQLRKTADDPPAGYLFVCPVKDFRSEPNSVRWPDYPAYWCLDPCGAQPLSPDEATHLGFPSLEFLTWVDFMSSDACVYTGLRNLYKAKGFDPESQDVARHLGQPLYQISNVRRPCPHVCDAWCGHEVSEEEEKSDYSGGEDYSHEEEINEDEELGEHSLNTIQTCGIVPSIHQASTISALQRSPEPNFNSILSLPLSTSSLSSIVEPSGDNTISARMPCLLHPLESLPISRSASVAYALPSAHPESSPWNQPFENSAANITNIPLEISTVRPKKRDSEEIDSEHPKKKARAYSLQAILC
ncbi:hypothetical protein K438DRAFT_230045 [Mycena galopus ATCC 62051]|nr:hypothetical protein K438DRAFT_230045 [Mycena galopus ATCC 62051]